MVQTYILLRRHPGGKLRVCSVLPQTRGEALVEAENLRRGTDLGADVKFLLQPLDPEELEV